MGCVVANRITHRHLATMRRLGIEYDLLVREGDVVGMGLWSVALERLQQNDRVYFAEDGKNAVVLGPGARGCRRLRGPRRCRQDPRSFQRNRYLRCQRHRRITCGSMGCFRTFFDYERFAVDGEHVTYRSARAGGGDDDSLSFGGADSGYNVIDVRQSYLQRIVGVALALLSEGSERKVEHTHFAYEMVALTPRTAEALGIPVGDDDSDRAYGRDVGAAWLRGEGRRSAQRAAGGAPPGRWPTAIRSSTRRRGTSWGGASPSAPFAIFWCAQPQHGDRLRYGRRVELRGRNRPVSAVRGRAGPQHLPKDRGALGEKRR